MNLKLVDCLAEHTNHALELAEVKIDISENRLFVSFN